MKNKLGLIKFGDYDTAKTKIYAKIDCRFFRKGGEREGHTKTFRKYQIAPSLYNRWRKKYLQEGIYGLKDKHRRIDPEVRALELENERLRRIIAKQALEIEVKSELLKKLL